MINPDRDSRAIVNTRRSFHGPQMSMYIYDIKAGVASIRRPLFNPASCVLFLGDRRLVAADDRRCRLAFLAQFFSHQLLLISAQQTMCCCWWRITMWFYIVGTFINP